MTTLLASDFRVGDRVTLARLDGLDARNGLKAGMTGTVRRLGPDPLVQAIFGEDFGRDLVLVKFDGYTKGTRGGEAGDGTPSHRNILADQLDHIA